LSCTQAALFCAALQSQSPFTVGGCAQRPLKNKYIQSDRAHSRTCRPPAVVLGINLGIELVQLLVVAAILPSLLLLSRTPAYALMRITGALFAALGALAWIAERLLGWETPVDLVVGAAASRAPLLARLLFLVSLAWRGLARTTAPAPRMRV
jgi:hypothetical protein